MRYLMVDRVDRIEAGRGIVATKSVSLAEDVFADHFVGAPVMPGALLIESLAQAGTFLLEYPHNYRRKALLIMVERAKFRAIVRPGDQLRLEVTVEQDDGDMVRTHGTIDRQKGRVADATLVFHLTDADEFYPPKARLAVEVLYDLVFRNAEIISPAKTGSEE